MIVLVANTKLTQTEAAEVSRQAIESVGGTVAAINLEDPDLVRMHSIVPGMGVLVLGTYLASGGVQLDPTAETAISAESAGVHASTLNVTLVVRLGVPDEYEE